MRIVIRPNDLPRGADGGAQEFLRWPWQWWRTRILPDADGNMTYQEYAPTNPEQIGGFDEVTVRFDPTTDYNVVNPPSFFIVTRTREISSFDYRLNSMPVREEMYCDLVWYEQPGPRWERLPGVTCRPGQYEISMSDGRAEDRISMGFSMATHETRDLIWYPPPARVLYERARLNDVDETVTMAQIPPPVMGIPLMGAPRDRHRDALNQIIEALYQYERRNTRRPRYILVNPEDYATLRQGVLADDRSSYYTISAVSSGRLALFGMEILIDRAVSPGAILVADGSLDICLQYVRGSTDDMYASTPVEPPSTTYSSYPAANFSIGASDVYAELHHHATFERGPSILPESDVVDEIDRLVNDSIRPGPQDDFTVNRYDRCEDCGCQWHGLECALCECINTDWLDDGEA